MKKRKLKDDKKRKETEVQKAKEEQLSKKRQREERRERYREQDKLKKKIRRNAEDWWMHKFLQTVYVAWGNWVIVLAEKKDKW